MKTTVIEIFMMMNLDETYFQRSFVCLGYFYYSEREAFSVISLIL